MTDNIVALRGGALRAAVDDPHIDAAEMLEHLAGRIRAGEVVAAGVAFVEMQGPYPAVQAQWSFAAGHRYNLCTATALLDHRMKANTFT